MSDGDLKFSDEVIAQVAKSIQVAMLSGTDVVDHFRQLRLSKVGDTLYLAENYKQQFEDNIDSMLQELKEIESN